MREKIVTYVLVVMLVLGGLLVVTGDGALSGDEILTLTYISNWHDLYNIRNHLAGNYVLTNNLTLDTAGHLDYNDPEADGWLPIGDNDNHFIGSFDGQNYTIKGLYIDRPSTYYIGLFGSVGNDGEVRNVGVVDLNVRGDWHVGGLVGYNFGTVSNSYATGNVRGIGHVGGLVGYNSGTVINSYATVDMSGNRYVGGLVGWNASVGTLDNSHYNIDSVLINDDHYVTIGGIFDAQYQSWFNNYLNLDILDYSDTLVPSGSHYEISNVDGLQDLLGFAGRSGYLFRLADDIDLSTAVGLYIPYLASDFDGQNHTISNLQIDMSFAAHVGMFGFISSGGGVRNIGVVDADVSGFGYIGGLVGCNWGGMVSNSYATGKISANRYVGGIVGFNIGTVLESYVTGNVHGNVHVGGLIGYNHLGKVSNSFVTGNVIGTGYVGGFMGWNNQGTVENSYAKVNVTRGAGSISIYFGGFVGRNDRGKIFNCYSTGQVIYDDAEDPTDKGFAGSVDTSGDYEMDGNFWDVETSGQTSTAGNATGKTTEDMMDINTFSDAGWDIIYIWEHKDETWYIDQGKDYPRLWWEEYHLESFTFDITLLADGDADGWNFVSFNLAPVDTSLAFIFADLGGNFDRVMHYDVSTDQWSSYVPGRAEHFNNLQTWNHRMGIWIRMTEDDTLTVEGYVPTSTDITLHPGWNMVGFPSGMEIRASDTLPDEVSKIGVFSASAEYNVAYLSKDLFDMISLQPSKGYWIYNDANEPVIWTVEY